MDENNAAKHERRGANADPNPMLGDWQHRFKFPPVPYGDGGAKRAAFREATQNELQNRFFYNSEVRLEITLHMDVRTVLETSEMADLDNYAKAVLDGLKGSRGILLDDSQVQTLIISWLDNHGAENPYFDISISSSPDDFILKPVHFYEMPDGMWYPRSRKVWSVSGQEDQSERQHYTGLLILEVMSSVKASGRHLLRKSGMGRLRAYQESKYFSSSSARGFHKGRIDFEFDMHDRKSWRAKFDAWKRDHAGETAKVEKIVSGVQETYAEMARLRAGLLDKGQSGL
jgi:hypothetical protein